MLTKLSLMARSALLAVSMIGGLTAAAVAGPASLAPNSATENAGNVVRIHGDGRYSDCTRGGDCWNGGRRWDRDRYWRRDRDWRRDRYWRGDRDWDDDRRWKSRYWRRDRDRSHRHHRRYYDGPSFRIYLN